MIKEGRRERSVIRKHVAWIDLTEHILPHFMMEHGFATNINDGRGEGVVK